MEKKYKIVSIAMLAILTLGCTRSKDYSQDVMSREAEKQTILLQEQVKQLTRIANALQEDTTGKYSRPNTIQRTFEVQR